jgi:RHS repeat-associated protein
VTFAYDALGRRVAKRYRGQTTRWLWDGDNPLHEWVDGELEPAEAPALGPSASADAEGKKRDAELLQHLSQGPPLRGTEAAPITWLFEPDSFVPIAKLVGSERYSIIGDQLGVPVLMADANGKPVFRASVSAFGELRELEGSRHACPFRWPGQYEDAETGLYYNRFRYYDPEAGTYLSQDPIGLDGGPALYAYVPNPLAETDPLGLKKCGGGKTHVFWSSGGNPRVKKAAQKWARENGGTTLEMTGKGNLLERTTKGLDWIEVGPAWDKASKHFAKRAAKQGGPVHVFVSKGSAPGPQSVWKRVEEPILRKDPNRQIIIHEVP